MTTQSDFGSVPDAAPRLRPTRGAAYWTPADSTIDRPHGKPQPTFSLARDHGCSIRNSRLRCLTAALSPLDVALRLHPAHGRAERLQRTRHLLSPVRGRHQSARRAHDV